MGIIYLPALGSTKLSFPCGPPFFVSVSRRMNPPDRPPRRHDFLGSIEPLTRREQQVLSLLMIGLSTADIATKLCRSEHTIDNHIRTILRKLGSQNRVQAALIAIENNSVSAEFMARHG
jgi:DNA-binding NarL/FixJ family response regulator